MGSGSRRNRTVMRAVFHSMEHQVEIQPSSMHFDDVAAGVTGVRIVMVNVYAIRNERGWVLVDAGLPWSAPRILRWAEQQFGPDARPQCIVLTHGHFDHVGGLRTLLESWNVPVYAHRLEMPYLTGKSAYPPPDPVVGRGMMALLAPTYPRGPIQLGSRVQALPQDGTVPYLPDWRWIHTPGHTPGHVSFFRDSDRTLIAGDAVANTRQESLVSTVLQKQELHGPPAYYTSDWEAARKSVERLAALEPQALAAGHGTPIKGGEVAADLRNLASNFDREIPSRGRYVRRPAVADEDGVVYVPPPVANPNARALALAAVAGGAWWLYSRRHSD